MRYVPLGVLCLLMSIGVITASEWCGTFYPHITPQPIATDFSYIRDVILVDLDVDGDVDVVLSSHSERITWYEVRAVMLCNAYSFESLLSSWASLCFGLNNVVYFGILVCHVFSNIEFDPLTQCTLLKYNCESIFSLYSFEIYVFESITPSNSSEMNILNVSERIHVVIKIETCLTMYSFRKVLGQPERENHNPN